MFRWAWGGVGGLGWLRDGSVVVWFVWGSVHGWFELGFEVLSLGLAYGRFRVHGGGGGLGVGLG